MAAVGGAVEFELTLAGEALAVGARGEEDVVVLGVSQTCEEGGPVGMSKCRMSSRTPNFV